MKIVGFRCPHCPHEMEAEVTRLSEGSYRKWGPFSAHEDASLWGLFDKVTQASGGTGNPFYGALRQKCPDCGKTASILIGVWVLED